MEKEISNLNDFLMLATEVLKTTQKDFREYTKYIYSDDDKLVVTDGSILITMDKTKQDIAPGFYKVAKVGNKLALVPASFEGKYPNYKMVTPDYTSKVLEVAFTKTEYMKNLIKLQDIALKYCGGYVAEKYFELLKKSEFIYQVFTPEKECGEKEHYPVLFKSNAVSVIIMPKLIK